MPSTSNDPFDLRETVTAVVGGASGIGEAVASGVARQGGAVIVLDRDAHGAARVGRAITAAGGRAESGALDLLDGATVTRVFEDVRSRYDRLDGVVCTPAVNVRKPLLDYTEEEYDRVVELNLKGSFRVLRAAGRIMSDQRAGSIVLFSSIRSQVVEPGQGVYAATKAGIVQLVRAAAAELGPAGVRVNAVAPGVVETPLTAPIKAQRDWYRAYADKSVLGRWARADEMAGPTIFLLSAAASFVTGSVLFVDGGWTAADGRFSPPGM